MTSNSFLQADGSQTLLPSIGNTWIITSNLANGYGSVITCTMVDGKPAVLSGTL